MLVDFFFPTCVRGRPALHMLAATLAAAGFGDLYYHIVFNDTFLLTLDLAGLRLGVYVSMRREQPRRGAAAAATPASMPTRIRRIAGVWTFFALISIWADASSATFGQRVEFFVSLFGLR
jgi:hypothetical protein